MKLAELLPRKRLQRADATPDMPSLGSPGSPEPPDEPLQDPYYLGTAGDVVAERRQVWRSRQQLAALIVLGFLCLLQAAIILAMLPLQRTTPYLVTFHDSNDMLVSLHPVAWSATTAQLIQESTIHNYIRQRTEIVPVAPEMNFRWFSADGIVPAHSSAEAYRVFQPAARELWNENVRNPFVRRTRVRSLIRAAGNLWRAEFTTTDDFVDPGTIDPEPLHWTVTIQTAPIRYEEAPTRAQLLRNPTGLIVTQWVQAPILGTSTP